jgi:hypothetical protein
MKANEAPERLYLSKNIYSTFLYQVPDPDDETAVEYTRTNAFVEKACKWLKENADHYVGHYLNDDDTYMDESFIEDFEKYMKEE